MPLSSAKYWIMKHPFEGMPKLDDLVVDSQPIFTLKDGEFLCEAIVWSIDPYNRAFANGFRSNSPMVGLQLARVIESKNQRFKVGDRVIGHFGWRTLTVASENINPHIYPQCPPYQLLPKVAESIKSSAFLGTLGMPGITAYIAVSEICKVVAGDLVVINSAAGCVGSTAGQLAKRNGATVIGIAGTDQKCDWLKSIGFDYTINYKTMDITAVINQISPGGIDSFLDNVGGESAKTVFKLLKSHAKVCFVGSISDYNNRSSTDLDTSVLDENNIFWKKISVFKRYDDWEDIISKLVSLFREGHLVLKETEYYGFDQMPKAMIDQLSGDVTGKVVVLA